MTTEELAKQEEKLIEKIDELNKIAVFADTKTIYREINNSYLQIHRQYAELASNDIEALKRGLFIQWFCLTEPTYLTGISSLDVKAEKTIIEVLDKFISQNNLDDELKWMLNHYINWDYVFDKYKNYKHLNRIIENRTENKLILEINNETMSKRGSMGKYWSSFQKLK
jgi:hypothetical protein